MDELEDVAGMEERLDGLTMLLRRGCERGAFAVVGAIGPVADGLDWYVECAEEENEEEEEGEECEDMDVT